MWATACGEPKAASRAPACSGCCRLVDMALLMSGVLSPLAICNPLCVRFACDAIECNGCELCSGCKSDHACFPGATGYSTECNECAQVWPTRALRCSCARRYPAGLLDLLPTGAMLGGVPARSDARHYALAHGIAASRRRSWERWLLAVGWPVPIRRTSSSSSAGHAQERHHTANEMCDVT